MSKDVKIEIIYFKSKADVSLEFGLHGDYPVRMLSTSCDNLTSFYHSLKRAISRSEIILITGGYTSNDYIPSFLSKALSTPIYTPDYKSFNIITNDNYKLPENAVPLAGSNRIFGGFLIESGPQTIISLTEDKKTRLLITKEIIVKYITEHHAVFGGSYFVKNKENSVSTESKTEDITVKKDNAEVGDNINVQTNVDISLEFTDISSTAQPTENTDNNATENNTIVFDFSNLDSVFDHEEQNDVIVNHATDGEIIAEKYTLGKIKSPDIQCDIDEESYALPLKHKNHTKRKVLRIVCIILSLLIALGSVAGVIIYRKINPKKTKDYYSAMADVFYSYTNKNEAISHLSESINNLTAWLSIPSANIDFPVILPQNAEMAEQLKTHLPDGTLNQKGTVFTTLSTNPADSDNIFLYGNGNAGGVFESLLSPDMSSKFYYTDKTNTTEWRFISKFTHDTAGDFDYKKISFENESQRKEYILKILSISSINSNIDVYYACPKVMLFTVFTENGEVILAAAPSVYVRTMNIPASSNENSSNETPDSSETNPPDKIIIGVNDGDIVYVDKEDSGEYEQVPDNNEEIIPDISVPSNSSSAESTSVSQSSEQASSSTLSSSSIIVSSSTVTSSIVSSAVISSTVQNPTPETPPTPTVDPFLTWDINITVTNGTNIVSGTAVEIVARVVEAEMGSSYNIEALKSQAICTYAWLINNGVLDGKTPYVPMKEAKQNSKNAVNAVKGTIITYDGKLAQTYCHAYSAGYTASYQHIWQWNNWQSTPAYPYLQSVESKYDNNISATTTTYTADTVKQLIKDKFNIDVSEMPKEKWIEPVLYDSNNLYCVRVNIGGNEYQGQDLRNKLFGLYSSSHKSGLKSSAYTVSYDSKTDMFTVICKGWGHGVGLSQRGAKAYADAGWNYEQILTHYFKGTVLKKY
jgi:stage II sporulation protein D